MAQERKYELECLSDKYWKLGPLAWLLDYYLGMANERRPVFDESVANALGTTEEIIEDWRWFLAHEGLIRQHKVKAGGWLVCPNPNHEELLDDWLQAWRRLRYEREALWW